ncbi:MAG: pyrroline-5-carboxylate reductase dimerization domain-containing protein, partial [Sphingomonadales bacterium]
MSDLSQITDGRPLLVVGCGKMGGALLGGWLKEGLPAKLVHVVEPMGSEIVPDGVPGDQVYLSLEPVPQTLSPRLLLLAVKPQMMADVLPGLQRIMAAETLLLSIAAGTRIERLTEAAGKASSVIRAIPNTPSAIGKGVAVLVANPEAGDDERRLAESLLSVSGEVHWLTEEKLLDAVTGLSGSGPAYVFYLVEAMA